MSALSFTPSGYKRWGTCTASPAALVGVERKRKASADEGTIAHALQAISIVLDAPPSDFINELITVKDIGDVKIKGDMAEFIQQAIDYMNDHINPEWKTEVELRVDLGHVIPKQKGDADLVAYDEQKPYEIHFFDLKYGMGVKELAERNGEIMLHAIGFIDSHLTPTQRKYVDVIVIHIVQPRLGHYDSWQTNRKELNKFKLEVQEKYQEAIDSERRRFVASVGGCRFCEKKTTCPTLRDSIYAKAVLGKDAFGGIELKDPDTLSDDDLAEMWEWLDFISAWTKNVEEHMLDRARKGVRYAGLKLIDGREGKREWKDREKAEEFLIGRNLEEFEMYDQTLITAPQAEKILGTKNLGEEWKKLISRKPGSSKLVKESDAGKSLSESRISEFDD